MNKKLFTKYNQIEIQLRVLIDEKRQLGNQIISDMAKNEVEKVQADFGTFNVIKRNKYLFDEKVELKIKDYKEKIRKTEAKAVQDGQAKLSIMESLRFLPKK